MRPISGIWITLVLPLVLLLGQCLSAQVTAAGKTNAPAAGNSSNTIKLQGEVQGTTKTVRDCITVEAMLLPREPASKLFGGWVADNYAVVETTVSNHCPDQQFILHDIFFDYSDWALSGVYKGLNLTSFCSTAKQASAASSPKLDPAESSPKPDTTDAASTKSTAASPLTAEIGSPPAASGDDCDNYTQSTQGGQVATVGAKAINEQLTEASVFSKRNLVVNGLVLVGTVAGGYAFVGSTAAVQGIGAYNSAFIPGLQKFWPDRRIQQETNVLTYGYRTDQSTAIAKEANGSYYAFFPISTFLMPTDLKALFLSDPAVFLNPAEVLLDLGGGHSGNGFGFAKFRRGDKARVENLRIFLLDLAAGTKSNWEAQQSVKSDNPAPQTAAQPDITTPQSGEDPRHKQSVQLLLDLASPCPGHDCPYPENTQRLIFAEKFLFAHASLNSVKIVVRGVMTVNVDSIPPTIDTVTFDGAADEASYWTVPPPAAAKPAAGDAASAPAPAAPDAAKPSAAGKTLTGVIVGKYLTDGTPAITAITVPGDNSAKLTDYIVDKSLQAVSDKSTDSSMAFTLQLAKTLPSGSKLTFQVTHSTGDATKGTSSQTTSNKFVYTVTYAATPANPTVTKVTMDNDDKTDVWQTTGKLNGTAVGTDLDGGTIAVSALQIGGKPATVTDYIGALAEVPKSSTAVALDFQLPLHKAVPDGSTVSFVVSKQVDETTVKSTPTVYTVTKPAAPAKKTTAKTATNCGIPGYGPPVKGVCYKLRVASAKPAAGATK